MNDITEVVSGDGSDAVKRLGGTESPLHDDLLWARNLKRALDNGLRMQLSHLRRLKLDIEALPSSGLPGKLRTAAANPLDAIEDVLGRDSFFEDGAALASAADDLDKLVATTVTDLAKQQEALQLNVLDRWQAARAWQNIGEDDRTWFNAQVAELAMEAEGTLDGLKDLLNHDFSLNHQLRELDDQLTERAATQRAEREEAEKERKEEEGVEGKAPEVEVKPLLLPASLNTAKDIQNLIDQLTEHLNAMHAGASLKVTCRVIDDRKGSSGNTYP